MSITLEQIAKLVSEHEESYWDGSVQNEPEYTRHVLEHMAKLIGKLGNVVEPREHGLEPSTKTIKEQVIPDLLITALGMARVHEVDLEPALMNRLEQNRTKITNRRQGILETPST